MRLRPHAWSAYWEADDGEVVSSTSVMAALVDLEAGESPLPKNKQAELAEAAPDVIPNMIAVMNDWVKLQSPAAVGASGFDWLRTTDANACPAGSNKTGRNGP